MDTGYQKQVCLKGIKIRRKMDTYRKEIWAIWTQKWVFWDSGPIRGRGPTAPRSYEPDSIATYDVPQET